MSNKPSATGWRYPRPAADPEQCRQLAADLKIPVALATLLHQRGLTTAAQASDFLHPSLATLPSPFLMKDMETAVQLIITAFKNKWPIVIHGDYDVDGKSGTALLAEFLKTMDIEAICYLPDRLTDGYGLREHVVKKLAAEVAMPALLITVDCGVTAIDEIRLARQLGFRVIVTDHHQPPEGLPEADALVNPKQSDCPFPFPALAGVGVVFYLTMGIRRYLVQEGFWSKESAPNLKQFLDLVALGTVADVMPLVEVNRILVRAGLEVLSERSRPGLWALCERAELTRGQLTADDISYKLAPRLNAAGRIGDPNLALELLRCTKTERAMELAHQLELANQQRKHLEEQAVDCAIEQCRRQVAQGFVGLVAYGPWHPGIIGIVASRIVDRFQRPAIILTDDPSGCALILKGSGRCVAPLNLYELLAHCRESLIQFGGHKMAAGLTLYKENLADFSILFNEVVAKAPPCALHGPGLAIDYHFEGGEIFDATFMSAYSWLEPFGEGNPEPIFLATDLELIQVGVVRSHLKFKINNRGAIVQGIGFGMGDQEELALSPPVQLAFKLKNNCFRGVRQWEVHAVAFGAPATEDEPETAQK